MPRHAPLALALALACSVVSTPAAQAGEAGFNDPTPPSRAPAATAGSDAPAGADLATIEVVGRRGARAEAPGTTEVLEKSVLVSARALTVNEALRKVAGVTVRDEEGFGLRPNIGIRGSNPTRSTKVLLLEDGLPAMYAPYGDNASYYHAPIQRYDRIEVLKGAGLLRFGPQTIHGAINYITPTPPREFAGHVEVSPGTRGFGALHASFGGQGLLVDLGYKEGAGARDNTALEQADLFVKLQRQLNDTQAIALRANLLRERSQVGYSGITDAELRNFGREYYPFENDRFEIQHSALSLSHEWRLGDAARLLTSAYYTSFERDWWRQSSTTTDSQCGTAFRTARFAGQRVAANACNSVQGRLRNYYTAGVDSRLSFARSVFGGAGSSEVGLRWHDEKQLRYQLNGSTPDARNGILLEDNLRTARALSGFATTSFDFGRLQLTPSLRHEDVDFGRRNRLVGGASGRDAVRSTTRGLAANWQISGKLSVYASAHQGFAPPRVEDLIDGNGSSTAVDAEESLNLEAGLRARVRALDLQAALFSTDFDNQIVVGSVAGGSTPLAQGATEYLGVEFAAGYNRDALDSRQGDFYANLALTWLPTADQASLLRRVDTGVAANGSVVGNRLPYAPELSSTLRIGYVEAAWDGSVEVQQIGGQYADFANHRQPTDGSGQFGAIDGYMVWSATLNYLPQGGGWSGYVTVKNLADRTYIVDRTRGILLGNPRQFIAGARFAW